MLIDSGADRSVIDVTTARHLGLVLPPDPDGFITTSGGTKVPRWSASMLIRVLEGWHMIPVSVRALEGTPLLGRAGVFDRTAFAVLDSSGLVLAAGD